MVPELILGGRAVDDRGSVSFVNGFGFEGVRRFYAVQNHSPGLVRAWHGHRHEEKYVFAAAGAAKLGVVEVDDWKKPSRDIEPRTYVLTAEQPRCLFIPAGYANGFMTLVPNTVMLFFSTATLEESQGDDHRFPARYWDVWHVEER